MQVSLTPERWEQVQRLFDEVVDLEPAARAVRLDKACHDDPGLREEVESLLAATRRPTSCCRVSTSRFPIFI